LFCQEEQDRFNNVCALYVAALFACWRVASSGGRISAFLQWADSFKLKQLPALMSTLHC
jgi:hypothetical protein